MTPYHPNEPTPQPPEPGSPESLLPRLEPFVADTEVPDTSRFAKAGAGEEIPILPVVSNVEPTDEMVNGGTDDGIALSTELPKRGTLAVLGGFVCFLLLGICHSNMLHSGTGDDPYYLPDGRELVHLLVEFEAIATLLVLFTFAAAGRPPRILPSPRRRSVTWLFAPFALLLLLAFNFAYGHVIKQYVGKPPFFEYVDITDVIHSTWLLILLVCIQPGVVEELFFRHLMLGHFRNLMGNHGAVWASAVLFGAVHIHNQPGLPVLIVLGAGLGYLRLYSGSLLLPMLAHGVHNGVVLAFH
jgi:membrane protease YdiL (CAAX protease family)